MTLDKEIFARFLGLWLMREEIPQDIYDYVKSHECPSENISVKMAIAMIFGAPNPQDNILRDLVLKPMVEG